MDACARTRHTLMAMPPHLTQNREDGRKPKKRNGMRQGTDGVLGGSQIACRCRRKCAQCLGRREAIVKTRVLDEAKVRVAGQEQSWSSHK